MPRHKRLAALAQQTLAELSLAVSSTGKQRRLKVLQKIKQRKAQQTTTVAMPDLQDFVRQDRER